MNQSYKYVGRSFIPYRQATKILKPGVRSLYDPSVPVPAKFAFILMSRNLVFITRRNNRLNTATDQQSPKFIAVIGSVCNEPLRFALFTLPDFYLDAVKRRLCQRHFRGGSLLHVYSERSTRAIGQYHELCSLATFCLPDQWAPFFARTNIPSIKHSSQRTFCWSESWLRKARHRFRRTPVSAHGGRCSSSRISRAIHSTEHLSRESKECPRSTSDRRREGVLLFDSVGVWANIAGSIPIVCRSMHAKPFRDVTLAW